MFHGEKLGMTRHERECGERRKCSNKHFSNVSFAIEGGVGRLNLILFQVDKWNEQKAKRMQNERLSVGRYVHIDEKIWLRGV